MTRPVEALAALLAAAVTWRLDVPVRWQVTLIVAVVRAVGVVVTVAHPVIPRPILRALQAAVRKAITCYNTRSAGHRPG